MAQKDISLPELLAPAGGRAAFEAAVEAGADAVYLGGSLYNARMSAANFGDDDMKTALADARAYGVKVYVTLNTQLYEGECADAVRYAGFLYEAGADALIIADLGAAAVIKSVLPELPLHASTQACGHGVDAARFFARAGFSRMVCSRELTAADIRELCRTSPIEIEMFVHGAHCVSVSGQCLASAAMGGRSGNRGECAQPCRLSYELYESGRADGAREYPLSLRDMSLAGRVPELLELGVSSLKIEGRAKSASYVFGVVSIWRRLLDERRAASADELEALADIFSRDGFTDGYFTGRYAGMEGIRTDANKRRTREASPFAGLSRKVPLNVTARFAPDTPSTLTLTSPRKSVTVAGGVPAAAIKAEATAESVGKNLLRFGGTPFTVGNADITVAPGLYLPVSELNALRRAAVEALTAADRRTMPFDAEKAVDSFYRDGKKRDGAKRVNAAVFLSPEQITPSAREYFDEIALPVWNFAPAADSVWMPTAYFDRERALLERLLSSAAESGARYAYIAGAYQAELAASAGLTPRADFRCNAFNSLTARVLRDAGCESVCAPFENATGKPYADETVVYGRFPLMTLTRCLTRRGCPAGACRSTGADESPARCAACGDVSLRDRKGAVMPVIKEFGHRQCVYNAAVVWCADTMDRITAPRRLWLFTDETAGRVDAVIDAYKRALPPPGGMQFRRPR
jgi:putative protease